MRKSFLKASLLILVIGQSQAATLEFHGAASVDNGSGFSPALHYMLLSGGDRVRALKGCAKIIYDNGYCTKVCDGQMAVVFSTPPEPVTSCFPRDATAVSTTQSEYIADDSPKNTPAVSPTPPEYVGGGSLKDSPALVASPGKQDSNLLPVGILLATGIGTAIAVGSGGDSVRSPGDNIRAASP